MDVLVFLFKVCNIDIYAHTLLTHHVKICNYWVGFSFMETNEGSFGVCDLALVMGEGVFQ